MSNRTKLKQPGRNLRVLIGRAAAEVQHGVTGTNIPVTISTVDKK